MGKNNLLLICETYTNFQKDPIDLLANHFNNISVFVKYNPIAEISRYISLPALIQHNSKNK
ncbi:MAG: glycosyltransferase family 4 protein, partial [Methanosarcina flavescens]